MSIATVVLLIVFLIWAAYGFNGGDFVTGVDISKDQTPPFSHKHHVGDDGIDCRYCHQYVETSNFAGVPPTETCMSCHSELWTNADMLQPVRASWASGESLHWTRIHDLPDFVYFNHSIHISKGVGCSTCHGRVDQMPLMRKVNSLYMEWCVSCHRDPAKYVRPKSEVFNPAYETPAPNQDEIGPKLVAEYHVQSLTDCVTCHR